jgi:hypothetical protein
MSNVGSSVVNICFPLLSFQLSLLDKTGEELAEMLPFWFDEGLLLFPFESVC